MFLFFRLPSLLLLLLLLFLPLFPPLLLAPLLLLLRCGFLEGQCSLPGRFCTFSRFGQALPAPAFQKAVMVVVVVEVVMVVVDSALPIPAAPPVML